MEQRLIIAAGTLLALILSAFLTIVYWGWRGVVFIAVLFLIYGTQIIRDWRAAVRKRKLSPSDAVKTVTSKRSKSSKPIQSNPKPAQANSSQRDLALTWQQIAGSTLPALSVIGIVLYGALAFSYSEFYGALGVDPQDVGLSYTSTLAHSSGLVLGILLAAIMFVVIPAWMERRFPTAQSANLVRFIASVFCGYVLFVILMPLPLYASRGAEAVKIGQPVRPSKILLPASLTVLAIHADPVSIEPLGKSEDSPALGRLQRCASEIEHRCKLLYLGQSNGTAVIYDSTSQRAVYLPLASAVLTTDNCATKRSQNPDCRSLQKAEFYSRLNE